jgi:hypothetical protein
MRLVSHVTSCPLGASLPKADSYACQTPMRSGQGSTLLFQADSSAASRQSRCGSGSRPAADRPSVYPTTVAAAASLVTPEQRRRPQVMK